MYFRPAVTPPALRSPEGWCFGFFDGHLLLPEGLETPLAPSPVLDWLGRAGGAHYLGRLDAHDCWAATLTEVPPGWRAMPLRAAMMGLSAPLAALAGRAAQVLEWDRAHRFCGACGTPTETVAGERARRCPACGQVAYPRVSPAMMVLIWREGEVLLARSPHYVPGVYSALAGFVEAGESLEECVHREVAEEVGVEVDELRYYGSQSWPFPHSLMVAYSARWTGGEIVPQAGEIEDARWFGFDALPPIPPRFSISGHLIRDRVRALRGRRSDASPAATGTG